MKNKQARAYFVCVLEGRQERRTNRERTATTRALVLNATIEQLAEAGYGRTTTVEVAERAGVSRGAIVHHFSTRSDLVLAALEYLCERRLEELEAGISRLSATEDRLSAFVDLMWSTFDGPLFTAQLELWMAARTDPALHAVVYSAERRMGHEIHGAFHDIFPSAVGASPGFDEALNTAIYLMRGLAMTRILREDPIEEDRILNLCTSLLKQERPVTALG